MWLCSITLKPNTALFIAEWPLKLAHAASLSSARRTTALWGNKFPITNHSSNTNTSK